ncbi:alcohol dehydrogenase catalytic domain-containing protein [Georgenia sp. Z1491]|uniref:alcohol dehydrogenase catalytic domain-containing protein n=1 Tax=Georgenia sp. Z1491 TaxID=3416707 RepID=UPI003CF27B04
MRAVVLRGKGDVVLTEVPTPSPGPGEVLLRVAANTVCGTDVRLLRGEKDARPGVVLGHEAAGVVAEVGDGVTAVEAGDLVAVLPTISCGSCFYCRRDLEHHCEQARLFGYQVDGGLAEYQLVPADAVARGNLVPAPSGMDPAHLALAEPLACVLNGLREYTVELGDTVLVMGAGPIGLLHLQVALLRGARHVVVTNRSAERRQVALDMGATLALDPATDDLDAELRALTDGRGADVAVISIGAPELFNEASRLVRVGGRVSAFAGFPKGGTAVIDPNDIHYGQLTVTGGSNCRRSDYHEAVGLLASGAVDGSRYVTHRFDLDHALDAVELTAQRGGLKVAVVPGGTTAAAT